MDALDRALLDAWARVSRAIQDHPTSPDACRRRARAQSPTLRRPVRPWCLCIRASDTRIHTKHWQISEEDRESKNPYPAHWVYLDGPRVRELVRPVDIDWPGVDWVEAARRLGRHPVSLRSWIASGVFKVARHNARSVGKRGNPVPFVYTHAPIDPNFDRGRAPDRVWGQMWQTLHERIPENFEQVFQRIPRMAYYRGKGPMRFRGWRFICQGRHIVLPADGRGHEEILEQHRARNAGAAVVERGGRAYVHVPCLRAVDSVFCPLPVWTMGAFLGMSDGRCEMSDVRGGTGGREGTHAEHGGTQEVMRGFVRGLGEVAGVGMEDWSKEIVGRSFACARCWGVRYGAMTNRHGWNEFVSHVSGGLLYGREVKRPREWASARKRREFTHKEKRVVEWSAAAAARREEVEGLMAAGLTYGEIARSMGVSVGTVGSDARAICRRAGVKGRGELVENVHAGAIVEAGS